MNRTSGSRRPVLGTWLMPMAGLVLFSTAASFSFGLLGSPPAENLRSLTAYGASLSNARMLFIVATVAYSVSLAGSFIYSCAIIVRVPFTPIEIGTMFACGVAWLLALWRLDFGIVLGGEYGAALLATIAQRAPDGPACVRMIGAINTMTGAGVALLAAAACALVHPSQATSAQRMAICTRHYIQLLYLTTGALLVGMLFVFSINHWAALLADPPQRAAAVAVGHGILMTVGIFYSVMLVICFVPTALVQMRHIERLERGACESEPSIDLMRWRAVNGLQFSPLTAAKTYTAMASPLIGGALQFFLKPLMAA